MAAGFFQASVQGSAGMIQTCREWELNGGGACRSAGFIRYSSASRTKFRMNRNVAHQRMGWTSLAFLVQIFTRQ